MGHSEITVAVPAGPAFLLPPPIPSSSSSWKIFLRLWAPEASNLESEEGVREPHPLSHLYFPSVLSKEQTVPPQHIHPKKHHPEVAVPVSPWSIHSKHHPEVTVPESLRSSVTKRRESRWDSRQVSPWYMGELQWLSA